MSWSIGLSIGISFVEISATRHNATDNDANHQNSFSHRWYRPRKSMPTGIKEFIASHPQIEFHSIQVTTQLATQIVDARAGTSIALLVTSGFQNWPMLRQPVHPSFFSLFPERAQPLIDPDLIFGISERIDGQGNILTPLEESEMDFLAAKLKLANIHSVAVGFLHSQVNPVHEKQVANFFKERGFDVICSHQVIDSSNEVARWWRAILNAYLVDDFHHLHEKLIDALPEGCQINYWSSEGFFNNDSQSHFYPSTFGIMTALLNYAKKSMTTTFSIVHFGLESFYMIHPERKSSVYHSPLGPIAVAFPEHVALDLQPTQIIDQNMWGSADLTKKKTGYEPGPMIFGKGLRPTFVDLLYLARQLPEIEGFEDNVSQRIAHKIRDAIYMSSKNRHFQPLELTEDLVKLALDQLAIEIGFRLNEPQLVITGPFASFFTKELQTRLPNVKLALLPKNDYIESFSASQVDNDD